MLASEKCIRHSGDITGAVPGSDLVLTLMWRAVERHRTLEQAVVVCNMHGEQV
jgi:hypothetical protein